MYCHLCNHLSDSFLCHSCTEKLSQLRYDRLYPYCCPVCNRPVACPDGVCSWCNENLLCYGPYDGILEELIHTYKHGGNKSLARTICTLLVPLLITVPNPLLLPIPSSLQGKRNRGFDQMYVVASLLKRELHVPVLHLFKHQNQKLYTVLSRSERILTSRLSLCVSASKAMNRFSYTCYTPVILDDVRTTGTTTEQARSLWGNISDKKPVILVLAKA